MAKIMKILVFVFCNIFYEMTDQITKKVIGLDFVDIGASYTYELCARILY